MADNPHFNTATALIRDVTHEALVEAQLAVAYELRTANLIALTNSAWATGTQIEEARKELRGRL